MSLNSLSKMLVFIHKWSLKRESITKTQLIKLIINNFNVPITA